MDHVFIVVGSRLCEAAYVNLLEGGPHVLPSYPEDLSRSALEQLRRLGVEVTTSAMVSRIEPGAVYVGDSRLNADVVLCAAGVPASLLGEKLRSGRSRAGRVLVQPDLSLPDHPELFVIGDLAALKDASGKLLPGVPPVAILEGRYVAKLIAKEVKAGAPSLSRSSRQGGGFDARSPFPYHDKGSLATIGRSAAIAQFGKIHLSGFIAWPAWLFVHNLFLIGFRNRYERGAGLITGSTNLPGRNAGESADAEKKNRDHQRLSA